VKVPTPLGRMQEIVVKCGYQHTMEHFEAAGESVDVWVWDGIKDLERCQTCKKEAGKSRVDNGLKAGVHCDGRWEKMDTDKFKWKKITWGWCGYCGDDDIEVFTDCEGDYVCDGDKVRCRSCGCPGCVGEMCDESMTISWHDEPGCECEWCKAHPVEEEKKEGEVKDDKESV